jgi:hypothetical protein
MMVVSFSMDRVMGWTDNSDSREKKWSLLFAFTIAAALKEPNNAADSRRRFSGEIPLSGAAAGMGDIWSQRHRRVSNLNSIVASSLDSLGLKIQTWAPITAT